MASTLHKPDLKCHLSAGQPISRRAALRALGLSAAAAISAGLQPASALEVPAPVRKSIIRQNAPVRPQVAIGQVSSYDPKLVRQQVQAVLDQLGGLADVVHPGDRVAIKVNLTGGTHAAPFAGVAPIESYVTHPLVVQALGELLRDAGARRLYIVEGVFDARSFADWGYLDVAQALDATLIDLNQPGPYQDFTRFPVGHGCYFYTGFQLNPLLGEVDAFISIPKMKLHNICGVTNSMKNLVGLVPAPLYNSYYQDPNRSALHGVGAETWTRLPRAVVDINRACPIHFALIDGIKTIESGEGPWEKVGPVDAGVLIAGKNALAADAVATAVMGFDPTADWPTAPFYRADNHLNLAREMGLGTNRLEEIEVLGTPIEAVRHPFKPVAPVLEF